MNGEMEIGTLLWVSKPKTGLRMDGETIRDVSKRSISIKTAVALLSLAVRAPFWQFFVAVVVDDDDKFCEFLGGIYVLREHKMLGSQLHTHGRGRAS